MLSAEAVALAARGHTAKRTVDVGWDALTPTERRVATLVASGASNAEVARQLVMGTATVKTHLSRAFQKLGVANRAGLAAVVARRTTGR